ncbi:MAG: hypothetical protein J6W08_03610 [Alphaproteobacteria bacterium]|nr:hypothetical protein [Alphaproteobacteria bacterium]
MTKFIKLGLAIFAASCAINTPSQNRAFCGCDIIYGRMADWDTISDDLARNIYEHNLNSED